MKLSRRLLLCVLGLAASLLALPAPVQAQSPTYISVRNGCVENLRIILRHNLGSPSSWATSGWFAVPPTGESFRLYLPGTRTLVTHDRSQMLWAYIVDDHGNVYDGDETLGPRDFAGRKYTFTSAPNDNPRGKDWHINVMCH